MSITSGVLVLDQLIKSIVLKSLASGESFSVIGRFLQIRLTHNSGMAFGILQGQSTLSIWMAVIVTGLILYYYDEIKQTIPNIGLALVLGGTMGNLVDRIQFNYVIDYLDIWFWPVFNIADIALTVGVAFLIFAAWDD